jgi:methyl-accepting chemotaxis protein
MNIKRIGLNKMIQIGFGGVISLMIINGAASFMITNKLVQSTSWVTHTYEVQSKLANIVSRLVDAETGQRGFLYTSKETFLEPYMKALPLIAEEVNATRELVKDNPAQVQRLKVVNDIAKQKLDELSKTISLHKAGKKNEALLIVSSGAGKKIMDDMRVEIDEMNRVETDLLEQRMKTTENYQGISTISIVGGTFLSMAIGIFVLFLINRKFLRPVSDVINVVSSISAEIAATITQHERTASQQVTAANETSATIEELSVSSRKSSEQAASAAAAAEKVGTATVQGGDTTRQAVTAMGSLKDKIGAMAEQILHLGEQTGQIGNIAVLVKDLSAQINMLALNAAVEAARAGEHGKGFAVVASEVRKLADETKKSAEQAGVLVAEIQKATNSSIMMTEEGARTVAEVTQLAVKLAELFDSLAGMAGGVNENAQQVMLNAQQQSAAFNQVVQATNSIVNGAKDTAAGISQTKIGVQNLNEAAENLKAIA